MALPSSGAITLSDVNTNIGASATATITMNDTAVRLLSNGDTTTNPVTMNGLYGKSWVWTANFSGAGTNPNSVATDSAGNSYALLSGSGMKVVKANPVGIMQWATSFSAGSSYTINTSGRNSIVVSSAGNVYCVFRMFFNTTPFPYYFGVVKLNSSGAVQWSSFLSAPTSYIDLLSIGIDSSENVYVSHYNVTSAGTATDNGMCVAKYNSSGSLQWQRRLQLMYGATGGAPLVVDSTNNYVYISGMLLDSGLSQLGGFMGKYDTNLSASWQSLLSSSLRSYYCCTVNPATQNVYGMLDERTVVAFNSSGAVQWQQTPSSGGSIFYSLAVDASGNTYSGFRRSASTNQKVYVKLNSSGALSAQIAVAANNISIENFSQPSISGSYFYVAGNTTTSTPNVPNGVTMLKIPTSLNPSGTYGNVTFSSSSFTYSAASNSFTTTSVPVVSTSFTEVLNPITGSDVTSSFTKAITYI
jgi:hypothetical protein